MWTLWTVAHTVPFLAAAAVLIALNPVTVPVALALLAHAWIIPGLHGARGANVLRPRAPSTRRDAELGALGLLGDLLDHDSRELQARTGLALEQTAFGVWLVGEAGAVLVRPGGRRVHCYCVKATDPSLPSGDRIAHLLLALRTDESGFATVANLAFSGARWRLRRRLPTRARPALDSAVAAARASASSVPTATATFGLVLMLMIGLALVASGCGSSAGKSRRSTASLSAAARPPAPTAQVKDALLAAIKTARSCLTEKRMRVSGGPVYPLQSPTSPDGELIVGSARGGAVIALYTTATRAAQLEPDLASNAQRAAGEVERRGSVTVLWIHHPAEPVRQAVLTCAFA